jgi:predicted aldo/keto reductase-like oxidoreductase
MEPVKGGSLANLPAEAAALLPGGSPASYAVRFAAGFEGVEMVLSGMSSLEQMEDNLSYMEDFQPLTKEDHQRLEQVKPIYQGATRIPCTGCRYCEEKCPMDVPISTIFAQLNQLHKKEGNPKADYAALRTNGDDCMKCGWCMSACPQQLQVYQLVEMAHKQLTEK